MFVKISNRFKNLITLASGETVLLGHGGNGEFTNPDGGKFTKFELENADYCLSCYNQETANLTGLKPFTSTNQVLDITVNLSDNLMIIRKV